MRTKGLAAEKSVTDTAPGQHSVRRIGKGLAVAFGLLVLVMIANKNEPTHTPPAKPSNHRHHQTTPLNSGEMRVVARWTANTITPEQCMAALANYEREARGGQVVIEAISKTFGGTYAPHCVQNFERGGPQINAHFFDQ